MGNFVQYPSIGEIVSYRVTLKEITTNIFKYARQFLTKLNVAGKVRSDFLAIWFT